MVFRSHPHHVTHRRLVGVFLGKYQFSVIYPPVIWTSWITGALEDIVPLKYVCLIWGCDDLGIIERGLVKSFELTLKAFCCQRTGHLVGMVGWVVGLRWGAE